MTISTSISRKEISLHGFVFVHNVDLVTGIIDLNTTAIVLIAKFQALMIR